MAEKPVPSIDQGPLKRNAGGRWEIRGGMTGSLHEISSGDVIFILVPACFAATHDSIASANSASTRRGSANGAPSHKFGSSSRQGSLCVAHKQPDVGRKVRRFYRSWPRLFSFSVAVNVCT